MKKTGCKKGEMRMGGRCVPTYCKKAKKFFGVTDNPYHAGFIMPDGTLINVSYETPDGTVLTHTHYTIAEDLFDAYPEASYRLKGQKDMGDYEKFIHDCQLIRYYLTGYNVTDGTAHEVPKVQRGGEMGCELSKKPTQEQIDRIAKDIRDVMPRRLVMENIVNKCFIDVDDPRPLDIQKFISKCLK